MKPIRKKYLYAVLSAPIVLMLVAMGFIGIALAFNAIGKNDGSPWAMLVTAFTAYTMYFAASFLPYIVSYIVFLVRTWKLDGNAAYKKLWSIPMVAAAIAWMPTIVVASPQGITPTGVLSVVFFVGVFVGLSISMFVVFVKIAYAIAAKLNTWLEHINDAKKRNQTITT